MKRLSTLLATITSDTKQAQARIDWEQVHSPAGGYKRIRHKPQAKKRQMKRRVH